MSIASVCFIYLNICYFFVCLQYITYIVNIYLIELVYCVGSIFVLI